MWSKIKKALKTAKNYLSRQFKKLVKAIKSWKAKAISKQTILTFYAIFINSFNLGKRSEEMLNKQAIITTNILIYE